MIMNKNNPQAGLIKLILIIIVAIIILSYFGINLQRIADSETGKANFGYVWTLCQQAGAWLVDLYQKYLGPYLQPFLKYLPFNGLK